MKSFLLVLALVSQIGFSKTIFNQEPDGTKYYRKNGVVFAVFKDGKLYLSEEYVKVVPQEKIFSIVIEMEELEEKKK